MIVTMKSRLIPLATRFAAAQRRHLTNAALEATRTSSSLPHPSPPSPSAPPSSGGSAPVSPLAPASGSASVSASASPSAPPVTVPTPPLSSPAAKPRSKLLRPRKAAMTLTAAAIGQLRQLLAQPAPKLIRVGVRNRGCSGLAYSLEFVERAGAFDETVEQDGVRVLIDSKALFSIIGSEMDWVEDKLSRRFVFRNPNIKEQCGCGESFMV